MRQEAPAKHEGKGIKKEREGVEEEEDDLQPGKRAKTPAKPPVQAAAKATPKTVGPMLKSSDGGLGTKSVPKSAARSSSKASTGTGKGARGSSKMMEDSEGENGVQRQEQREEYRCKGV